MAKTAKKLEDFFGARRRAAILLSSQLLRSKGKERRMKLSITMPLSNSELTDIPTQFLNQFGVMEKQDAATNRASIDVEFDSMSVRIFSTDSVVEPTVSIQGALLHKFAMVAEGTGDKRTVSLDFLIYLPASEALRLWEWDHIHEQFFMESVKAQGTLSLSGEADDDDSDEDEEELAPTKLTQPPPDKRIQVIPPPTKSGPKDLAVFHAQQSEQPTTPVGRGRRPGTRVN